MLRPRYVIDGNKVILLKEDQDQKVDDFGEFMGLFVVGKRRRPTRQPANPPTRQPTLSSTVFEVNETYSVDIALSTGEGKPRPQEHRTTVFKRAVDKSYRLKMKASRYLLTQVSQVYLCT